MCVFLFKVEKVLTHDDVDEETYVSVTAALASSDLPSPAPKRRVVPKSSSVKIEPVEDSPKGPAGSEGSTTNGGPKLAGPIEPKGVDDTPTPKAIEGKDTKTFEVFYIDFVLKHGSYLRVLMLVASLLV